MAEYTRVKALVGQRYRAAGPRLNRGPVHFRAGATFVMLAGDAVRSAGRECVEILEHDVDPWPHVRRGVSASEEQAALEDQFEANAVAVEEYAAQDAEREAELAAENSTEEAEEAAELDAEADDDGDED